MNFLDSFTRQITFMKSIVCILGICCFYLSAATAESIEMLEPVVEDPAACVQQCDIDAVICNMECEQSELNTDSTIAEDSLLDESPDICHRRCEWNRDICLIFCSVDSTSKSECLRNCDKVRLARLQKCLISYTDLADVNWCLAMLDYHCAMCRIKCQVRESNLEKEETSQSLIP